MEILAWRRVPEVAHKATEIPFHPVSGSGEQVSQRLCPRSPPRITAWAPGDCYLVVFLITVF